MDYYCACESGTKLVKCNNCDSNFEECEFRWTKEELIKIIKKSHDSKWI